MSEAGKAGKVSQPSKEPVRARDKVAAFTGMSGRTLDKADHRGISHHGPLITPVLTLPVRGLFILCKLCHFVPRSPEGYCR